MMEKTFSIAGESPTIVGRLAVFFGSLSWYRDGDTCLIDELAVDQRSIAVGVAGGMGASLPP
jgi:hypothetical protein